MKNRKTVGCVDKDLKPLCVGDKVKIGGYKGIYTIIVDGLTPMFRKDGESHLLSDFVKKDREYLLNYQLNGISIVEDDRLLTWEEAKEKIMNDETLKAKRVSWNATKWITYSVPKVDSISADNLWNIHTKEQAIELNSDMALAPHFIYCNGTNIYYGLENVLSTHKANDDWMVFK